MSVLEIVGNENSCASKTLGDVQVGGDLEKAAAYPEGIQKKTQMLLVPHTEKQPMSQETP